MKFTQRVFQLSLSWLLGENIAGQSVCNSIWSKPLWQRRRRRWACVIHRVVDSCFGMLPPVAKYTQQQQAVRGPVKGARVHATSSSAHAAAGRRFWRENQQRRSGLSLNREGWVVAPHCALSIASLYHRAVYIRQRVYNFAAAPVLYAGDPQAVAAVPH